MMTTTRIPERYRIPREDGGTLEEFTYDYEGEKKRALVYLPREARSDPGRRFPTLTLFHGGGDSEDSFFGGQEAASPFKPMLDCMIAEGTIAPLIVVTPTYYHRDPGSARTHAGDAMQLTETFHREVNEALIPAIDAAYPTITDRNARAAGGFSMGAEATWSALAWGGQNIRYYLPMSGDFWARPHRRDLRPSDRGDPVVRSHARGLRGLRRDGNRGHRLSRHASDGRGADDARAVVHPRGGRRQSRVGGLARMARVRVVLGLSRDGPAAVFPGRKISELHENCRGDHPRQLFVFSSSTAYRNAENEASPPGFCPEKQNSPIRTPVK